MNHGLQNRYPQILILLFCLILTPGFFANNQDKSRIVEQNDRVSLNLNKVNIQVVVDYLARFSDEHYLIDPTALNAEVSIKANKMVTRQQAVIIMEQALNFYGFDIVQDGLVKKVIPNRFSKQTGIPIKWDFENIERLESGGLEMRFIRLQYASVRKVNMILNTMIGRDGQVIPYVEDRVLQIIDSTAGMQRQVEMIQRLDVPDEQMELYVIHLENTTADATINQLKAIFTKNLVFSNSPNEIEAEEDKINFYSDARTNTILVVSHPKYIEQIRETVRVLDRELGEIKKIRVYTVRHAEPDALAKQLTEALPQNAAKITPDKRLNALILMAQNERMLETISEMAKRLDIKSDESQSDVQVYYLEHTVAKEIAETLTKLFEKKKEGSSEEPVSIVPDEATNALVITGTRAQYLEVLNVIKKLDIFRAQVLVEAVIVEVSDGFARSFGVNLGGLDGGNNFSVFGAAFDTASQSVSNGLNVALVDSAAQEIGDVANLANGTLNFENIRGFMRAIQTSSYANVLSAPQLLTKDNQEAKITVGEVISLPTGINTNLNNASNTTPINFSREDVGLELTIKPRITRKKTITLELTLDVKNRGKDNLSPFQGVSIPTITKRSLDTVISTVDGGTIAIGGLLQENRNESENSIPILSKIPGIGRLFRNRSRDGGKVNLFIFLTPYILANQADTDMVSGKINQEMENAMDKEKAEPLSFSSKTGMHQLQKPVMVERVTLDGRREVVEDMGVSAGLSAEPEVLEPTVIKAVEPGVQKTVVETAGSGDDFLRMLNLLRQDVGALKPEMSPKPFVKPRPLKVAEKPKAIGAGASGFEEVLSEIARAEGDLNKARFEPARWDEFMGELKAKLARSPQHKKLLDAVSNPEKTAGLSQGQWLEIVAAVEPGVQTAMAGDTEFSHLLSEVRQRLNQDK